MKQLYIVCLLLAGSCVATAQYTATEAPRYQNQLTLFIGLSSGYFRDRNYSPLNYHSNGLRFGLRYDRTTASGHRWTGGLGGSLGKLKHPSEYERHDPADRYQLDISLGYLRRVGRGSANRQGWLGLNYRSYVDLTLYDGSEAVTFYGLHAFEAAAATSWKTGSQHRLEAGLSLPVFGLLARPPYTGWDKFIVDNASNIPAIITRGDWVAFGRFTGLRASAAWHYDLGNSFSTTARYSLAYYAAKELDPVRMLDNSFSLSSTLKF